MGVGACVSGVNPASTTGELIHYFRLVRPQCIIVQFDCRVAVLAAMRECSIADSKILYHKSTPDAITGHGSSWRVLLTHGEEHWVGAADVPALYATTSGTTGLPKVASISHRSVIARAAMVEHLFQDRSYEVRRSPDLLIFP